MELHEEVAADYRTLGLSLRSHPLAFYRAELDCLGVTPAAKLAALANSEDAPGSQALLNSGFQAPLGNRAHRSSASRKQSFLQKRSQAELGNESVKNSRLVKVAGLVLLRQRPGTAKGITFVTLEDETGTVNLIVHQRTWDRFHSIARRSPAWLATGRLECKESVIHVIVSRIEDLSTRLGDLRNKSRDFR